MVYTFNPAPEGLRQEECEFETSLGYLMNNPPPKKRKEKWKKRNQLLHTWVHVSIMSVKHTWSGAGGADFPYWAFGAFSIRPQLLFPAPFLPILLLVPHCSHNTTLWVSVLAISPEGKLLLTTLQGLPCLRLSAKPGITKIYEIQLGLLGSPQPPHSLTHHFVVSLLVCFWEVEYGLLHQVERRDESEAEPRQRQADGQKIPKSHPHPQKFPFLFFNKWKKIRAIKTSTLALTCLGSNLWSSVTVWILWIT